jgi:hypothetical protein
MAKLEPAAYVPAAAKRVPMEASNATVAAMERSDVIFIFISVVL